MSLKTFKALAYREVYLSKKKLKPLLIIFVVMSVLSVLAILSFDYGNIGRLIEDALPSDPDKMDADMQAEIGKIKEIIALVTKIYPILLSCFAVSSFFETCEVDEKGKWRYFYKSTPVTPLNKSAATFGVVILMNIISFIISVAFCLFISALSGIPMNNVDFALILTGIALGDFVGVLLQIGIKLFHSLDKAGILLISVAIAGVFGYQLMNNLSNTPGQQAASDDIFSILDILADFAHRALIVAPIVIVASVVLGFIANVLLYKRREK
ncbi:MAG: hypothetical protein ACI4KO_04085 [Ruminiclostridium sp.]